MKTVGKDVCRQNGWKRLISRRMVPHKHNEPEVGRHTADVAVTIPKKMKT